MLLKTGFKRRALLALLLLAAALLGTVPALAAEATDITGQCQFKASYVKYKLSQLTDGKFSTHFETAKSNNPWLEITAPAAFPAQGLYLCFGEMPESWEVQIADEEGDWTDTVPGDTRFLHTWVQLPRPATRIRVLVTQESKTALYLNELHVLAEGDLPSWVQFWQPTREKADLLFLMAHPGDEALFFGGALTTYAAEQGRSVVAAFLACPTPEKRSEVLNSLWAMGVKDYPVFGDFREKKSTGGLNGAYKDLGGKDKVLEWAVTLYRRFRPEVVVSHDVNGEDGHSQHKIAADVAQNAVATAAAEGECLDSFLEYGAWQVKKLYLHLAGENRLTFDWSTPLQCLNGRTGLDAATDGYAQYASLAKAKQSVAETGAQYDNRVFGLVLTTVGADERRDDFLEHIYDAPGSFVPAPTTPAPTPAPTPEPGYLAVMPALNERGYLDEGEFVYSSEDQGLWIYVSPTAKIIIERKEDPTQPLTWFEAELWGDVAAGELPRTVWRNPSPDIQERIAKGSHGDCADTALQNHVVFAMNTDYFTYRKVTTKDEHRMGIIIRDGEIIYDNGHDAEVSPYLFPNLDTLALYPDGSMTVHHSYELKAQDYLDLGATTVYSFGPYLVKDGELSEKAYTSSDSKNPRCALGMIEPGHYVAILCEGRLRRSGGVDMEYLAKLMRSKGCQVAMNLDGGQTAVFCFMGKQITQIGVYDGKTSARKTCEILAFGTSEQVGSYQVQ